MCGIAGIFNLKPSGPVDENLIRQMLAIMSYRGPDECGLYLDSRIGLGQVRLSIIGLESGSQPIGNEKGNLWIVYNGEAFNYIELKQELIEKGHRFTTETDTEVVLHLYEEYGPGCLKKINGQFAFAIWDSRKAELFLARDRTGIRPLFYYRSGTRFSFASEIKALFCDPTVTREIDFQALLQVFTFWTTLTPATLFAGIKELPPGHSMTIQSKDSKIEPYWSIPHFSTQEMWLHSFEEACEEILALLKDAVRVRLRADVPVGAYLSGGLDSSIVTTLIAKNFNNRLKTFSIGFEETRFDESKYQNKMVSALGTDHQHVQATNVSIADNFPDVIWHCEKPLLRTAPVPLFLLSRLVRENNFKVVLTGEGADEIFGGYNIFREAKVRHFWGQQPNSILRPLLLQRLYPYIFDNPSRGSKFLKNFFSADPADLKNPFFSHLVRWKNTGKNKMFFAEEVCSALADYDPLNSAAARMPAGFQDRDVLSRAQFLEMDIFLANYLLSSQGDRVAMAHSLEIRLPFLDHRVIEFAFRLPPRWRIRGLNEKYLLKRAFEKLIPDSVRNRAKQPYRAPIREVFFNQSEPDYLKELLSDDALKKAGLFDDKKVGQLIARLNNPAVMQISEIHNMAFVGILSVQLLYYQFIHNFPWRPVEPREPDKIIRIEK